MGASVAAVLIAKERHVVDEPSWRALRSLRRRLATICILIAVVIAIVGWLGLK